MGSDYLKFPILYSQDATNFNTLGLGPLSNTIKATVTEERNGAFYFEATVVVDDKVYPIIKHNCIIKTNSGHLLKDQLFRIKKIVSKSDGTAMIYAEHVSYLSEELSLKPLTSVISSTAKMALDTWKNNLMQDNPFIVNSDITTIGSTDWSIDKFANPRQALGGVSGSMLDIYGGEYKFDNYNISLLKKRGTTANTVLAYGRNIITLEQENNIASTYTSLYPYAVYNDSTGKESILTIGNLVLHADNVNSFPNPVVKAVDFSSEFTDDETPTRDKLQKIAEQYLKANEFGIPSVSISVSFLDLSKSADYAEYKALEEVNLCDEVYVRYPSLGVETTAKVIKTVWNCITDSYDSIDIGEKRITLASIINEVKEQSKQASEYANYAQIAANGKNMVFYGLYGKDGLGQPTATKKGDQWYKPNGEEFDFYIWNGEIWEFIMSTGVNEELQKEFEELKKVVEANTEATKNVAGDVADAKKNAEDALTKAEYSEETANASKKRIDELQNDFDGIVYENRNYLIGTGKDKTINISTPDNRYAPIIGYAILDYTILSTKSRSNNNTQTMFTTAQQTLEEGYIDWSSLAQLKLTAGNEMTFTYSFTTTATGTYEIYLADRNKNILSKIDSGMLGNVTAKSTTFTLTTADLQACQVVIKSSNATAVIDIPLETVKLELGTHSTRWSDALEMFDIVTTEMKTNIIQNDQKIQLEANRIEVINGQVVEMNATLTVQANQILAKVDRDGVVAAINVSPEKITIDAKRIDLWGDVVLQSWRYPGQTSINGGMIQTNTIISDSVIAGTGWFDKVFVAGITVGTAQIGDGVITNAKIGDLAVTNAKIKDLIADKITTGTLNAANVNIINLDVNNLTGNRTAFVQTAWNGINGNVFIDSSGLYAKNASGGKNVALTPNGLEIMSGDASGKIGIKFDYTSMKIYDVSQRQIGTLGSVGSKVVQLAALTAAGNIQIGFTSSASVSGITSGMFMNPTQTTFTHNVKINAGQFLFANSWASSDGQAVSRIGKTNVIINGVSIPCTFIGSDNMKNGIAFNEARCYIISDGSAYDPRKIA